MNFIFFFAMASKQPKHHKQRAKILDHIDEDKELRTFVDETKQRLILLGFIPPPIWRGTSSAYIKNLGV